MLLPGVSNETCPPSRRCDARRELREARRRTHLQEAFQLALIIAVDVLFMTWQSSRFPMLDRAHSIQFLFAWNAIFIAQLGLSRAVPRWTARRVASTWCARERRRFGIRG